MSCNHKLLEKIRFNMIVGLYIYTWIVFTVCAQAVGINNRDFFFFFCWSMFLVFHLKDIFFLRTKCKQGIFPQSLLI